MNALRRKWLIAGLVCGALLLSVTIWWPRGAAYKRQQASDWFDEYCQSSEVTGGSRSRFFRASEAFAKMGTNALPFLLNQVLNPSEDSALVKLYDEVMEELPFRHATRHVSQDKRRTMAFNLVKEMQPPAGLLLPALTPALAETNTERHRWAVSVLRCAGDGKQALVPIFARCLHETNYFVTETALRFLEELGSGASPAVADLTYLLQATEYTNYLHSEAAFVLGEIGSNAAVAVPLIRITYERETNWLLRCSLAAALVRIDPGQFDALRFLTDHLEQTSEPGRVRWVTSRLRWIGPNARPAIPALLKALDNADVELWRAVLDALKKIGAAPALYDASLRKKFNLDEKSQRIAAAEILAHNPADPEAQAALVRLIKNRSEYQSTAIFLLGETGTNALPTVDAMMEAFEGTNATSWTELADALPKIGVSRHLFLPRLKEKLASNDDSVRFRIASRILNLDPGDHDAVQALATLIEKKSRFKRQAIDRLGEIGPRAYAAIPLLQTEISSDGELRQSAEEALRKIRSKGTPNP